MTPFVVPAIVAMTTTPIAQREIEVVTRSHTPSQRSSSPGMSTLPSARFMFAMSLSRNMQMKMTEKAMRKPEKSRLRCRHARDRVRHRRRDLFGARLNVLGRPGVAQPRELVGHAQLFDLRRKILEEVSN